MGYKDITEGDKRAKARAARFIQSSKGTYGVEVEFEFLEPSTGTPERLSWQGWLSEAAIERTMKTMVEVLGYNGSEDVDANGVLIDKNALAYDREVKLVVEMKPSEDGTKVYPTIKWVNSVGGSAYSGVQPQTVKSALAGINFKAAFLAAKKGSPAASSDSPGFDKKEKLPF